jgi:hypothetical protein
MAGWILIAAAKSLFAAFDSIAPGRDHASDGSIGDVSHQAGGTSDHLPDEDFPALRNKDADHIDEVHAIDVDSDLFTDGLTMEMVVQFVLGRCRSGAEKRLRYIIYDRRIWEASSGWKQRVYSGTADPHINHAHFSFSYDTPLEASTASWHLEDIPVALTADDKKWISAQIAAIADQVWAEKIGNKTYPARTAKQALNDLSTERDNEVDPNLGMRGVPAGTPLDRMVRAADVILAEEPGKPATS